MSEFISQLGAVSYSKLSGRYKSMAWITQALHYLNLPLFPLLKFLPVSLLLGEYIGAVVQNINQT